MWAVAVRRSQTLQKMELLLLLLLPPPPQHRDALAEASAAVMDIIHHGMGDQTTPFRSLVKESGHC